MSDNSRLALFIVFRFLVEETKQNERKARVEQKHAVIRFLIILLMSHLSLAKRHDIKTKRCEASNKSQRRRPTPQMNFSHFRILVTRNERQREKKGN